MLSCRNGALYRTLTLLGLVFALFVMAHSGFAQPVTEAAGTKVDYTTYPFLGVDASQRNMLINSFVMQSKLFSAFSGQDEGLSAFNLIAIMGALVGALMLFFNAKIRKPIIIMSWLLVVILVVFSPYGSKLLFYPISTQPLKTLIGSANDVPSSTDCKSNPSRCGFAPQIAAVHVASILQLMFSDAFRSAGWTGMMEVYRGEKDLASSDFMAIPPTVVRDIDRYNAACGQTTPLETVLEKANTNDIQNFTGKQAPLTLLNEWSNLMDTMRNVDSNKATPPVALELWGDADFKKAKDDNGWSSETQQAYEAGLASLVRSIPGNENSMRTVMVGGCGENASGCSSADVALKELEDAGFFKVTDGFDQLNPGFFFYWNGLTSNPDQEGADPTTSAARDDYSAADARQCYRASGTVGAGTSCAEGNGVIVSFSPDTQSRFVANTLPTVAATSGIWKIVDPLIRGDDTSELAKMPIATRVYTEYGKKEGDGQGRVSASRPSAKRLDGQNCMQRGALLVESIVKDTIGGTGAINSASNKMDSNTTNTPDFDKFVAMLLDKSKASSMPEKLELKDICDRFDENLAPDMQCGQTGSSPGNLKTTSTATSLKDVFNKRIETNLSAGVTDKEKLRQKLLGDYIGLVKNAIATSQNVDTKEQKDAVRDGTTAQNVGSTGLTWLAGGLASMIGSLLVNIGAFFVGPLAAAIIFFMTILVDMSLMILIVLTPFLMLAGVFVPANAIGVLTVAIVGTFVLKFVPVTLVILNYLGAMILSFIGIGASAELAGTMQSMIIIAMGGLYASVVTMTFFLLFKMGDASAILSRFTALDNNAKEIAQRGMAATMALAGSAALLGAGTIGALAGRATMGMAAKKAAANMGVPPGWIDAAKMAVAETPNKDDSKGGAAASNAAPENEDMASGPLDDGLTAEERAVRDMNDDVMGAKQDQATIERAKKQNAASDAKEMARDVYGFTKEEAEQLVDNGSYVKVDENGNAREFELTQNGDSYGVQQISSSSSSVASSLTGAADGNAPASIVGETNANAAAAAIAGEGTQTAGGIPASVTIAGGNLDTINEVGRVQQATIEQSNMQDRVKDIAAEKEAERQAAENNSVSELANKVPSQREQLTSIAEELNGTTDLARRQELLKQKDDILKQDGTSEAKIAREEIATRNMNDQIAGALMQFDEVHGAAYKAAEKKKKSGQALSDFDKTLLDTRDGLANFETAGVAQGEIMSRLGTFESLNASLKARAGADNMPGYTASALSGLYGAFAGTGGGLSKIPVLGPAISESLNEYYQAPERARAVQAAGGGMAWWNAQGNAKRMGFYQKEMAPLAAAQQYDSMSAIGGFQAQADLARQAASEAVARSRSQWEAMVASRAPTLSMDLRNQITAENTRNNVTMSQTEFADELSRRFNVAINKPEFKTVMSAGELAGLGRMDAADKLASVRQEAFLMQGAALQVKRVKGGLDENMLLKAGDTQGLNIQTEEVGVILTPEALARVRGDLTTKAAAKKYDEMMITHYGLAEKQFLRGDAQWDATRNMNTSREAATMFARKDVATDYLIGGHLNMVQGKERFLEGKAQYDTLVKFRNDTNSSIAKFVQDKLASAEMSVSDLLKSTGAAGKVSGLSGQALATNTRLEIEKWAGKEMVKENKYLPLNLIFESASARGGASYKLKAQKARSEIAAENAAVWESVDKARRAAINSALGGMNSSARKAAKTDWNGFAIEAGAPLEILTEWIDSALGSADDEVFGSLSKAVPKAMQDSFLRSEKKSFKVDGKDYREVVSYMNKEAFNSWLGQMNDAQRQAILSEKKYYRDANGRIELSRTVMDSEGNIREDLSHNR